MPCFRSGGGGGKPSVFFPRSVTFSGGGLVGPQKSLFFSVGGPVRTSEITGCFSVGGACQDLRNHWGFCSRGVAGPQRSRPFFGRGELAGPQKSLQPGWCALRIWLAARGDRVESIVYVRQALGPLKWWPFITQMLGRSGPVLLRVKGLSPVGSTGLWTLQGCLKLLKVREGQAWSHQQSCGRGANNTLPPPP